MKPLAALAAIFVAVTAPVGAQTPVGIVPPPSVTGSSPPVLAPAPDASPTAVSTQAAGASGQIASIVNSGSTNAPGYTITVAADGSSTTSLNAHVPESGHIDAALATKFYADLASAVPLQNLPAVGCMRSASFGSSTVIFWRGARTPDLSCAQNDIERTLAADAAAIVRALDIKTTRDKPHGLIQTLRGAP